MRFKTIRQTAAMPTCPVGEKVLRRMVHNGEVPGIYSGNRFLVNTEAFFSQIEAKSMASVHSKENVK